MDTLATLGVYLTRPRRVRRILVVGVALTVAAGGACTTTNPSEKASAQSSTTSSKVARTTKAPSSGPSTTRAPFRPTLPLPPAPPRTSYQPAPSSTQASAADLTRIPDAINRGAAFVVTQAAQLDGPSLLLASNIGLTYDLAPLAGTRDNAITKLAADTSPANPLTYLAAPMFRRMVWRDAPITVADIEQLSTEDYLDKIQWLAAAAYACGTDAFPADWSPRVYGLLQEEPNGGYLSTHAGIGFVVLRELGCPLTEADALRDAIVENVKRIMTKSFVPNDSTIEAAVVLQLLGRADLIQPGWITKTLDAQRPDGSWAQEPDAKSSAGGDWHTTLIALWFLAAVQQPQTSGPFFS